MLHGYCTPGWKWKLGLPCKLLLGNKRERATRMWLLLRDAVAGKGKGSLLPDPSACPSCSVGWAAPPAPLWPDVPQFYKGGGAIPTQSWENSGAGDSIQKVPLPPPTECSELDPCFLLPSPMGQVVHQSRRCCTCGKGPLTALPLRTDAGILCPLCCGGVLGPGKQEGPRYEGNSCRGGLLPEHIDMRSGTLWKWVFRATPDAPA